MTTASEVWHGFREYDGYRTRTSPTDRVESGWCVRGPLDQRRPDRRQHGDIMTYRKPNTHTLTSYLPLATTLVGVTLVVTGVAFFYVESDLRGLVSVMIGLAILIISVWFAAHPFRRGTRRYRFFRREIAHFLIWRNYSTNRLCWRRNRSSWHASSPRCTGPWTAWWPRLTRRVRPRPRPHW